MQYSLIKSNPKMIGLLRYLQTMKSYLNGLFPKVKEHSILLKVGVSPPEAFQIAGPNRGQRPPVLKAL